MNTELASEAERWRAWQLRYAASDRVRAFHLKIGVGLLVCAAVAWFVIGGVR